MKPVFVPHADYQAFVLQQLRYYFGPGVVLIHKDWPLAVKLWQTVLSAITTFLQDAYSARGPLPRDPASLLRSYLLYLMTNPEIGLTEWINEMKRKKTKRGKKGEKAPTTTPGKVKRLVTWMMRHAAKKMDLPADPLFYFFQSQILSVSAHLDWLGDLDSLSAASDGTPIVTAAYPRSKPTCACRARGIAECSHLRNYSQPDCNSGWDSSREKYDNGYHLYMISAAESKHDLPLYPRLQPASRHDAVSLVMSTVDFKQRFTLGTVDKMLLDAAHDAEAIYLLLDQQNIEPFIDLNIRSKKNTATDHDIQISPTGIPICPKGHEMKPNGFDKSQNRQKWRCTPSCGCSDAKYGRTYHTHSSDNPRLFTKTVPTKERKWITSSNPVGTARR
ncbi:transposase [Paenibacillus sp. FSL H8-0548]|uniref:transposase n=1 Tax=Paenibacillus sp. FSL H8-0548 TaxID=1920422 RepID=UPI0021169569|nr:transposase [Paenibacillus sp. FSL H8-0548]